MTVTHHRAQRAPTHANGDAWSGAVSPVARLVRLAVESEDPAPLLAAAGRELGGPVGLAASGGEALGHAPGDIGGRRAAAVAAATARVGAAAPPGWRVVPVPPAGRVAMLAVAEGEGADTSWRETLDLVATLLGDQLARAGLRRAQAATFVRRLLDDAGLRGERARREGAAAGIALAPAYWAAVVACAGGVPRPDLFERIPREAALAVPGALSATVDGHVVLLHPDGNGGGPPVAWLEQVVARVRALAPSTRAQAIAAPTPVEPGELGAQVTHLLRLSRLGSRAEPGAPVVFAERYALDRLLWDNLAAADARGFVEERLGALIAWDREHRSDLLRVLEAALDFPRHDRAASRCYMHRNTFRNRLKQATDVLGDDLEDPDVRLAVHVALKLRRGLATHGETRPRGARARRDGVSEPEGAGRSR